jgi:hypothetical protein
MTSKRFAVLGCEIFLLAEADAVFAGAGAAHGLGALDEAMGEGFRSCDLGGRREREALDVEVAVADVADHGGGKAGAVEIGAGRDDALGEARDGDADVGGEDLRAGAEGAGGVVDVVPRLPEAFRARRAWFATRSRGRRAPGESASAICADSSDAGLADAVEFEEQRGLRGQFEVGIAVDGVDLMFVEELDAGDADAELNGFDDGLRRRPRWSRRRRWRR